MQIKTRISFALETSHPDCVRAYRSYMYGRSYGLGLWGRHRDSHNYGSRNNKPTLRHRRHNANNIHKAPRDRIYLLVLFKSIFFFFAFPDPIRLEGTKRRDPFFSMQVAGFYIGHIIWMDIEFCGICCWHFSLSKYIPCFFLFNFWFGARLLDDRRTSPQLNTHPRRMNATKKCVVHVIKRSVWCKLHADDAEASHCRSSAMTFRAVNAFSRDGDNTHRKLLWKPSHKPSGLWRVIKRFCPTSDSPEQTNPKFNGLVYRVSQKRQKQKRI